MSDIAPQYISPFAETVWFIDDARVNLDDMLTLTGPGRIVRVCGDPHTAVMAFQRCGDEFDHIAGMVSENP